MRKITQRKASVSSLADRASNPPQDLLAPHYVRARRHWTKTDTVLANISRATELPERAIELDDSFGVLASSIIHQQVSVAAGRTIRGRIAKACGGKITAAGILRAGPRQLKAAGASPQKLKYLMDLAAKVKSKEVDLSDLADKSDEEVIETLTRVKGVGVWTAKMFLIFHLGRPDVVAHEDLGLQKAVSKAYKVPRSRAAKRIVTLGAKWSPYSSIAALTLWNWLHANGKK